MSKSAKSPVFILRILSNEKKEATYKKESFIHVDGRHTGTYDAGRLRRRFQHILYRYGRVHTGSHRVHGGCRVHGGS